MIAQSQHIDEVTVHRYLYDWFNGEKMKPENSSFDEDLSEEQDSELIIFLTNNLLPTTQAIFSLVDEWRGIRYTVTGMKK